jgi:hypothetical protein
MDQCCMQSFVSKGFRDGFKLAAFGDRHTCETCGMVYMLQRVRERWPNAIGPSEFVVTDKDGPVHYTWQPVTH